MNPNFPPRADLEYDEPADGFPEATCGTCGRSPAAIRVRWWEKACKPITKSQFLREGRSESHYFCLEHRALSERVYVRFTSLKLGRAAR